MTDRINALTVVLTHDLRDDDIEPLTTAIEQLRGVLTVQPHIADNIDAVAEGWRVRHNIHNHLMVLAREIMQERV